MLNPFALPDPVGAQRRQARTNQTAGMRQAQQFSQPAGGNFADAPPGIAPPQPDADPAMSMSRRLVQRQRQPSSMAPAVAQTPVYQSYFGAQPVPVAQPAAAPAPAPMAASDATEPNWGEPTRAGIRTTEPTAAPVFYAPPTEPMGQTQPVGTPVQGTPNRWGNQANLDPAYIRTQVMNAFARRGGAAPTEQEIQYWVDKALTPDIYSDNMVRVGWNPYWEDRLITGSDSSDPRLAGNEGLISDPYAYGLNPIVTTGAVPAWYNAAQAATLGTGTTTTPLPTETPTPTTPIPTPTPISTPPAPTAPVATTTGNPGEDDLARARRILEEYLAMADPNTAILKEQQKEAALAAEAAARERALQAAAASGTSDSGTFGVTQQDIADALSRTLTEGYRDIDQWGEEQGRQNRLTGAQALQNLGTAESALGISWEQLRQQNAQFYAGLEQQAAQSAASMGLNWAQLAQQDRQFLMDLALRQAMAEQNANQWFFNTLLGGA